jgi:hypothetical protein
MQKGLHGGTVHDQPGGQPLELPNEGWLQIVTALLNLEQTMRVEREANVGAINFLFDRHWFGQKMIDFLGGEDFVRSHRTVR